MDATSHHRRYVSFECDSGAAMRDEDLPFGILTDLPVLGLRRGFSGVDWKIGKQVASGGRGGEPRSFEWQEGICALDV